ncbi:hypothetical protein SBA4_2730002 [Candidatus Sulfopaludibacter sp. SbA4]|nr:hypothetical protein SBA4_2730002 [Candidatus Sulfopaludibacter sp. SbA4]
MTIRFQADADLDPDIGPGMLRREPAIDWRGLKDSSLMRLQILRSCSLRPTAAGCWYRAMSPRSRTTSPHSLRQSHHRASF